MFSVGQDLKEMDHAEFPVIDVAYFRGDEKENHLNLASAKFLGQELHWRKQKYSLGVKPTLATVSVFIYTQQF